MASSPEDDPKAKLAEGGLSRRQAMFLSAATAGLAVASTANAEPASGGDGGPLSQSATPATGSACAAEPVSRPYEGFKGRIARTSLQSQPWWPPETRAPAKAPNIVIFLCDDLGFSDLGCYGSEIATPNLDRMATEGVRYINFHVEPTCSPTRAALLTGRNPHAVGFGFPSISGAADPGFPGYDWQLPEDTATAAEILRDNGYATLAVGKWHLSRPIDVHESMATTSWPTRRGFDRYYGNWGDPNQHLPEEIWADNHIVSTDKYPDGYFYMDDMADKAVSMMRGVRQGDPDKPFFLYFAVSAPHAPINAPAKDIAKYKGRYDIGWDKLREARFARQKALGLMKPDTRLPPRNFEHDLDVPAWSEVPPRERQLFAAYMETYAGLVDHIDQTFGKLRAALEEMGEWENTIVLMTSDNGASREGAETGGSQYGLIIKRVLSPKGEPGSNVEDQLAFDYKNLQAGLIGGPQTLPHYPRGWAMACNTPFRLYKADTFCGGHQVPMLFSWPAGVKSAGAIRPQYAHVSDVLPTLLDLVGVKPPDVGAGRQMQKMSGVSFAKTLADPAAPSDHLEQYTESAGSRRYYRHGWVIVTAHRAGTPFDDSEWQLYNIVDDPTETVNLAAQRPELVRELSRAWEKAAWDNQVFPINEGSGVFFFSRAPYEERYAQPLSLYPGSPTVPSWRSRWLMEGRTFSVRTLFSFAPGNQGTLFAHGGQGGGYGFYVEDGRLRYILNGYGRMTEVDAGAVRPGDHEAVVKVTARRGLQWDVDIGLDGVRVGGAQGLPMLFAYAPIGGIDIGADRRSPVSWRLYEKHGTFPYSGRVRRVTYEPAEWAPDMDPKIFEAMRRAAQHAG